MKHVLSILLLIFVFAMDALARDPVELRSIAFDEFMQQTLEVRIPLTIPVPAEYVAFDVEDAPEEESYWLRKSDARRLRDSGQLPKRGRIMRDRRRSTSATTARPTGSSACEKRRR